MMKEILEQIEQGSIMTQKDQILTHLKSGKPITPIDALNMFGCFRLGARIFDIKQEGHSIKTDQSKGYATYTMDIPSGHNYELGL
jgi:hypothetical protein